MCRLQSIAMLDYQGSVTTRQTDAGQSDSYVLLCFAGDTKITCCVPSIFFQSIPQSFNFGM